MRMKIKKNGFALGVAYKILSKNKGGTDDCCVFWYTDTI